MSIEKTFTQQEIVEAIQSLNLGFDEELLQSVVKRFFLLSDWSRDIIYLRFGLQDGRIHTREEVAREYNISVDRVRMIERSVLIHHSHPRRAKKIKDFYC